MGWHASVRIPLRSLHWDDPNEASLPSQGVWCDFDYDACVFLGARKKAQGLRHNILEFLSLPNMRCGHIHDPQEWSKSGTRYPTFEEAEYTPLVFIIAVITTSWAIRVGLKVESVPRLPPAPSISIWGRQVTAAVWSWGLAHSLDGQHGTALVTETTRSPRPWLGLPGVCSWCICTGKAFAIRFDLRWPWPLFTSMETQSMVFSLP